MPLLREKPIQWVEQGPVISLSIVSAPSRGPRAFDKFATVIHHDIRRPDAPDHCLANGRGFSVGYTSWQNLASYCGGEWFPRVVEMTIAVQKQRRFPWSR